MTGVLKYIFAAIFVALSWAVVLVFHQHVPIWPAIAVTVLIVIGMLCLALYRMAKSQRAAAKLESALDAQARDQSSQMRPDQVAEISAMQAEFRKAVGALKASKLGRTGRDALGVLPWYVIIGPPGAGKTTALRNSGLKFPYAASGGVRGVGGTRNCDWWLTNEAILLDTAGRWSTEDDDRDEWLAFLEILKTTRPQKPINGILVAVSVAELQSGEEETSALARKLRERVDEVMGRLSMVVPVYLLVTKCDLIPGFIETFGELRDKDRGQIWGISLPLVADPTDRQALLGERMGELVRVLETRALQRIGEERSLDARPRVYEFPQQFSALRGNITDLCAHLFAGNAFQDTPIMRGVYFTSGTQEGKPIDRIMVKMAEAFGIRPRVSSAVAPTKPKSYFVRDVFNRVVIPDRDVAVRSTHLLRKQRIARLAMTLGAFVLAVTFLFLPVSSYLENMRFVDDAARFVETLGRARGREGVGTLAPQVLEAVDRMTARLERFETKGPDISLRFGLYVGDKVMEPLVLAIDRMTVRPLLDVDVEQMVAFLRGKGHLDAESIFGALMVHLLLTQPKAAEEPGPESESAWAGKWVPRLAQAAGARWEKLLGDRATSRARHSLESALTFYALHTGETVLLPDRRSSLVTRVRTVLLGSERDPLGDLLHDPALPRDLKMVDVVGGAVTVFREAGERSVGPVIPGAFTADGWKVVRRRLDLLGDDTHVDEDAWVLGEQRKKKKIDVAVVQTGYFRRYIDTWKNFFLSLTMKEPTTLSAARNLLKTLMLDKPLETIWRNSSQHIKLKEDDSLEALAKKRVATLAGKRLGAARDRLTGGDAALNAAAGRAASDAVRRRDPNAPLDMEDLNAEFSSFMAFGLTKPTGLEAYTQIVAELQSALGESGAPDARQFANTLRSQRGRLRTLVSSYNDNGWETPTLERMLMPPLRGSEIAVFGASTESANRRWCESIVLAFDQLLGDRFPFVSGHSVHDARVADLEKFFQPGTGTLWQYFNEVLKSDIEHPAGTSLFRLKEEASIRYKPELLEFLKRAEEISQFLFKDGGKLGVNYAIRIRPSPPYEKVTFRTGPTSIVYFNSREGWRDAAWPARGASFDLLSRAGGVNQGFGEGDWALFHLLDAAKLERASDAEEFLRASWVTDIGGQINADFRPTTLYKPFRGLKVPHSVVVGAAGCAR
jgi:type VI secretion system protein ImpL